MEKALDHDKERDQVAAPSVTATPAPIPAAPVPLPSGTLAVGHAEDQAETDADRMADDALRRLATGVARAGKEPDCDTHPHDHPHEHSVGRLRRSPDSPATEVPIGREGGALDSNTSAAIDSARGRGRALDTTVLDRMQAAFSADFSRVRIHDDTDSARLNRMVSARAFTTGNDIFFGTGQYAPTTPGGERVLAHELAHTLQTRASTALTQPAQSSGPMGRSIDRSIVRRAGDKIAFDKQPDNTLSPEDVILSEIIKKTIDEHKKLKSQRKDDIENKKNSDIDKVNLEGLPDDDAKLKRGNVLKDWHVAYKTSGWNLKKLKSEILTDTKKEVEFAPQKSGTIEVISTKTRACLYKIESGSKRFGPLDESGRIAVKKGTNKEYLQDARGVYVTRYVHRGCSLEQMEQLFTKGTMLPRNESRRIGTQSHRFDFGGRKGTNTVTDEEREFLQQRDGSGKNQRLLSVTHAKTTRKIHSNHGEIFGSEAIIKIDLSLIPKGDTFNMHSVESHPQKVSLPQIRSDKNDPSKKTTKPREQELESYIYSAEKNRETVLLKIPIKAVVSVRMTDGTEISISDAEKKYDTMFETKKQAKELEEQRIAEQKKKEVERQQGIRDRNDAKRAEKESVDDLVGRIKDRAFDIQVKESTLSAWGDVDLWSGLDRVKPSVWIDILGKTEVENMTVAQAKKIFMTAKEKSSGK